MDDEPLYFLDEHAAFEKVESIRWPEGPVCVYCGAYGRAGRLRGRGARTGLLFCRACQHRFRVTIGTVFHHSHVPLHKWLRACDLVALGHANATQLRRRLQISYNASLKMTRAIRGVVGSKPAASLEEILRRAFEVRV